VSHAGYHHFHTNPQATNHVPAQLAVAVQAARAAARDFDSQASTTAVKHITSTQVVCDCNSARDRPRQVPQNE
jgi:hypothetical protein